MSNKVVLLGINEINFDYVKYYADKGELPNFKKLLKENSVCETISEDRYELLEPWIQWVTIHTGKSFNEHEIFRLGDITANRDIPQIFEELEEKGKSIGAVSPFNADNRLKKAKFFIPDPWTKTKVSGGKFIEELYRAVHQMVNDNASATSSKKSLITLAKGILRFVSPANWMSYFKLFVNRTNPGVKAVILDKLLSDIFLSLWNKSKPDFSLLFLNAGAHIQHHYLFNAEAYQGDFENPDWYCPKGYDPLVKILKEYDNTLGNLLTKGVKLVVATGLHQKPHRHLTYYWRLQDHKNFLQKIGVDFFESVLPRMSRDFLVNFNNAEKAKRAQVLLEGYFDEKGKEQIFRVDNRGNDLFVELIYPNEINDEFSIVSSNSPKVDNFLSYIAFVAIKNGEHDGVGYVTSNFQFTDKKRIELKEVKQLLTDAVLI